jgi:hypothetical protein
MRINLSPPRQNGHYHRWRWRCLSLQHRPCVSVHGFTHPPLPPTRPPSSTQCDSDSTITTTTFEEASWLRNFPGWLGSAPGFYSPNNVVVTAAGLELSLQSGVTPPVVEEGVDASVCDCEEDAERSVGMGLIMSKEAITYGYIELEASLPRHASASLWLQNDASEISVFQTLAQSQPVNGVSMQLLLSHCLVRLYYCKIRWSAQETNRLLCTVHASRYVISKAIVFSVVRLFLSVLVGEWSARRSATVHRHCTFTHRRVLLSLTIPRPACSQLKATSIIYRQQLTVGLLTVPLLPLPSSPLSLSDQTTASDHNCRSLLYQLRCYHRTHNFDRSRRSDADGSGGGVGRWQDAHVWS